jgi:hypothetical protein
MRLHRGFVEYCQSGKMEEEENGLALDWIGQSVEMLRYKAMQKGKKR